MTGAGPADCARADGGRRREKRKSCAAGQPRPALGAREHRAPSLLAAPDFHPRKAEQEKGGFLDVLGEGYQRCGKLNL